MFDSIQDLYIKASRIVCTFTISICVPLLVLGKSLLFLWVSKISVKIWDGHFLLTIVFLLSSLTNVPSFVANGLGKPMVCGFAAITNTIIYIIWQFHLHTGLELMESLSQAL